MPTITIRPSADINVTHSKYQNGSSTSVQGYTLIDDVTSDEDATTIGLAHHNTTVTTKRSSFKLGKANYNHAVGINSITLYFDYFCNNPSKYGNMSSIAITTNITVNGVKSDDMTQNIANVGTSSDSGGYKVLSNKYTPSNFSKLIECFESLSNIEFSFEIESGWKCGSGSVTTDQRMYISQVYAVIDYDDAYMLTPVGDETTTVNSGALVKKNNTTYFEATPIFNHRFQGWYSDSAHTHMVSTEQIYQVTATTSDLQLYGTSRKIEAINIYRKTNGRWVKIEKLYVKENGAYKTITAQEFGNYLYFSDKSYLNSTQ